MRPPGAKIISLERTLRSAVWSLGFVAAIWGCGGGAHPGSSCSKQGFLCQDTKSALECRSGSWILLPCRGASGCQTSGNDISCDVSADQVGDACASTLESKGMCSLDGMSTLECRDGAFVKTNDCSTCTVSGGFVNCQR